jgi:RNA polymerase sigma factor (sigma-70 family)
LEKQALQDAAPLKTNWDAEKDDKLLSSIANGDAGAWRDAAAAFYRRHVDYLHAICFNLANRYKFGFFDEFDLFQATMTKALKSADSFKAEGLVGADELKDKADAWLGGIAENVLFDLLRRKPKCVNFDPTLLESEDDVLEVPEIVWGEEAEDVKLMREAIDTLSPKEQSVIWATSQFYECREQQRTPTRDLDEIVESLGISRENFRKIRERARKKILSYIATKKTAEIPK